MCGIERKFDVCRQTLASWLKAEAKQIDFQDTLVDLHENEVIEVDEMITENIEKNISFF